MFMSIVNCVTENQVAAIRSAGLVAFCSARGSEVEAAQVVVDCPDGTGVTYDGLLTPFPITLYPPLPYTDFQLPCVVVSILTNVAVRGTPKNKPETTALAPAFRVIRNRTCPLTFHTR